MDVHFDSIFGSTLANSLVKFSQSYHPYHYRNDFIFVDPGRWVTPQMAWGRPGRVAHSIMKFMLLCRSVLRSFSFPRCVISELIAFSVVEYDPDSFLIDVLGRSRRSTSQMDNLIRSVSQNLRGWAHEMIPERTSYSQAKTNESVDGRLRRI